MKKTGPAALLFALSLLATSFGIGGNAVETKAASPDMYSVYFKISDEVYNTFTNNGSATLRSYWWGTGITNGEATMIGHDAETGIAEFEIPTNCDGFLIYNGAWPDSGGMQSWNFPNYPQKLAAIDGEGIRITEESPAYYDAYIDDNNQIGALDNSLKIDRHVELNSEYARYWFHQGGRTDCLTFLTFETAEGDIAIPATAYPSTSSLSEGGDTIATAEDRTYLAYFDVPLSYVGLQYYVTTAHIWDLAEYVDGTSTKKVLTASDFANIHTISWPNGDNAEKGEWNTVLDDAAVYPYKLKANSVTPYFFATYVLPAYYSCLGSEANGYLATTELTETWIGEDLMVGGREALADVTLSDYAYAGPSTNYDDYYVTGERTITTTALEKLAMMETLEAANSNENAGYVATFVSDPSNIAGITAGALVLVSILGFSVFYFVRRRKHASN